MERVVFDEGDFKKKVPRQPYGFKYESCALTIDGNKAEFTGGCRDSLNLAEVHSIKINKTDITFVMKDSKKYEITAKDPETASHFIEYMKHIGVTLRETNSDSQSHPPLEAKFSPPKNDFTDATPTLNPPPPPPETSKESLLNSDSQDENSQEYEAEMTFIGSPSFEEKVIVDISTPDDFDKILLGDINSGTYRFGTDFTLEYDSGTKLWTKNDSDRRYHRLDDPNIQYTIFTIPIGNGVFKKIVYAVSKREGNWYFLNERR